MVLLKDSEPEVLSLGEITPIMVIPYEVGKTPKGEECMIRPALVDPVIQKPQVHESWGTPLPVLDYCGYHVDGMKLCCPK